MAGQSGMASCSRWTSDLGYSKRTDRKFAVLNSDKRNNFFWSYTTNEMLRKRQKTKVQEARLIWPPLNKAGKKRFNSTPGIEVNNLLRLGMLREGLEMKSSYRSALSYRSVIYSVNNFEHLLDVITLL